MLLTPGLAIGIAALPGPVRVGGVTFDAGLLVIAAAMIVTVAPPTVTATSAMTTMGYLRDLAIDGAPASAERRSHAHRASSHPPATMLTARTGTATPAGGPDAAHSGRPIPKAARIIPPVEAPRETPPEASSPAPPG